MAGTVVNLADRRADSSPHNSGHARCLQCGHEWVAVVPVGVIWFDCPACQTVKGAFKFHVEPEDGTEVWACNCGSHFFVVTRKHLHCAVCGDAASFDDAT